MKILLSIKPEYSDRIFSGEKKYEFRKQKPRHRIDAVYVYASHPTKKIVGLFRVRKIISGSPIDVWKECREEGGIGEEDYFEYCGESKVIYAYQIEEVLHFENPINPSELYPKFSPPQSFSYLDQSLMSSLMLSVDREQLNLSDFA